jgi:hypothetical protein
MTDWSFANGVKIHIPDCDLKENQIQLWTDAKIAMSILLTEFPKPEVNIRKPYVLTKEGLKKRSKLWHKGQRKK